MTDKIVSGEKFWLRIIYIVSIVVTLAVAFLILGPRPDGMEGMLDVSVLPHLNALLNSSCTVLLLAALWFIKRKEIDRHKKTMLTAFGVSVLFLVSYVIYHWFKAGPKMYVGDFSSIYYSAHPYCFSNFYHPVSVNNTVSRLEYSGGKAQKDCPNYLSYLALCIRYRCSYLFDALLAFRGLHPEPSA